MATADQLITELIVDASAANAGANVFSQAAARIQRSSAEATVAVDKLGVSIDRAAERMQRAGSAQALGLSQFARSLQSGATDYATVATRLEQIGQYHQRLISSSIGAAATLPQLAQQQRAPALGAVAPSVAVATEEALLSVRPGPGVSKLERTILSTAATDPSVAALAARAHAAEQTAHAASSGVAQTASIATSTANPGYELLATEIGTLSTSIGRLRSGLVSSETRSIERAGAGVLSEAKTATAAPVSIATEAKRALPAVAAAAPAAISAAPAAGQIAEAANTAISAQQKLTAATTQAAAAQAAASTVQQALATASGQTATATQRAAAGHANLATAAAQGTAAHTGATAAAHNMAGAAAGATATVNQLGTAHNRLSTQAQSALHSIRAMSEGILLGVSPLQVLTQQFSHLSSAASGPQGLKGAFSEVAGIVGRFITGAVLITAPLAGIAGGFYLVGRRAIEIDANLRALTVSLATFHSGSGASAAGLEKIAEEFRAVGASAADVNAAIAGISRNPALNPGFAKDLVETSRRIGAAFGTDLKDGFGKLDTALSGGAEGIIKLGTELGVLGPKQVAEILYLQRTEGAQAAVKAGYDDIKGSLRPYEESLSGVRKVTEALTGAWEKFLDSLATSSIVTTLTQRLNELGDAISKANKAAEPTPVSNALTGVASGAGAGALAGGILAAPGIITTPLGIAAGALAGGLAGGIGGYYFGPTGAPDMAGKAVPLPPKENLAANFSVAPKVKVYGNVGPLADTLSHAAEELPPGYSLEITSGGRPKGSSSPVGMRSQHVAGNAVDYEIIGPGGERLPNKGADTSGLYAKTFAAAQAYQQWAYPEFSMRNGATFGARGGSVSPSSLADIGHIDLAGTPTTKLNPGEITEIGKVTDSLKEQGEILQKSIPFWNQFGSAQEAGLARLRAYADTLKETHGDAGLAKQAGQQAYDEVIKKTQADISKQAEAQDLSNKLAIAAAQAFGRDEVAGLQAAAMATATLAAQQEPQINVQKRYMELLQAGAAEAIDASARAIPGLIVQTAASQRLADATGKSAAAAHDAEIHNQAVAATHDEVTKAIALHDAAVKAGNPALIARTEQEIKQAQALTRQTEAQLRATDALHTATGREAATTNLRNEAQVSTLEIGLQGQPSAEIARQVELLRAKQKIAEVTVDLSTKEGQQLAAANVAYLAEVDARGQLNIQLVEAEYAQQRLEDGFRNIASTIDNTLTSPLHDALVRTPLEAAQHWQHFWLDFRTHGKQAIADILTEIAKIAFLNPLTGSIAGALGFGQVAQQYGTFGGLFTGAASAAVGGIGPTNISGSQLAVHATGFSPGSGLFNAAAGGAVFQSGTSQSVQVLGSAVAGQGAAALSGTGGLSEQQIQELLNAAPTAPLAETTQTGSAAPIEAFLGALTSASGAAATPVASTAEAATAAGTPTTIVVEQGTSTAASLAPQLPEAAAAVTGAANGAAARSAAPAAAATSNLVSPSNIGAAVAVTGLGSLLSQPGLLPSWLTGGVGGVFGGIGSAINNFGASTGLFATPGVAGLSGAQLADLGVPGASAGLFGTGATLGSALTGAAAGFGAGILLNSVLGGNQLTGTIGAGAGSLLGAAIGSFLLPGIGTLLGGILGGTTGGGLGGLLGGRPSGQSAGAVIGPSGQVSTNTVGASAANIQGSQQVADQIGSFVRALNQLTDAQGRPIGQVTTSAVVSSDNRSGITVTGSGIAGGRFGQNAEGAVTETELQIIRSLKNVTGTLKQALANISDPSQLQSLVQFIGVYDKLNVTTEQLTANLNGNTNAIGPFSQALLQINTTFSQLTAQAAEFGVSAAPISAALDAVTQTLNRDFRINIAEALSTAIDGGNDYIASLVKIHQTYVQNVNDAKALATGVPTGTTPGFAGGTTGTPPGQILVGEKGSEWMLPRGGDWTQVGTHGAEIIDQPGGAVILPNPLTPAAAFKRGENNLFSTPPAFASGTIGAADIAGQFPGLASYISQASGGPSLLAAAGSAFGISSDVISTVGSVLPVLPIVGGVLGLATGGNPLSAGIGIASGLAALALANPLIGVIGGLVGLVANLFGPKPSNKSSGDLIDLSSGAITDFQSSGDSKADQIVQQISQGIATSSLMLQQASGGSISGAINVQYGSRDGIKTSYSGPLGKIDAKWGSASDAVSQFALAIAHGLVGIDPALQGELSSVNDASQLIPTIQQWQASQAGSSGSAAPAASSAPPPPQLYSISQGAGAPSYVGTLTTADADWWKNAGATLTPYTGGSLTPARQGASLYTITQPGGGPSYVGDLTPADVQWWQTAGAAVTPYGTLPATRPNTAIYQITQPDGGPSYVGDLGPADAAWWSNTGATVTLSDGTMPTPRPGAALYQIDQGTGPWYIGDLTPADAGWWTAAGAQVTPFAATANTAPGFADGTTGTPPGWIIVGERGPEWMLQAGGATVLPHGVQPQDVVSPVGRSFAAGTDLTASSLSTGAQINAAIGATEAAQAGPVLAALGIDQLQSVIANLATAAPEIAQMAQNLIASGNALPDILTQGIQALTDPLDAAIAKERAAGQERIAIVAQTGQDLVKVEQLNSANLIQAVISNLGNANALNAITYPGNTRALEYLQAAPTLANLSGQQLTAVLGKTYSTAPDLAALAQTFIATGTALPDAITQALEGITDPLRLAIQQQAAQANARNQIQQVTGQDAGQVAALNTASVIQAVVQQIGNPTALQALVAHGSAQGLAALQAGPAIAGLGLDQLQALLSGIGAAAPDLTNMIQALISSGNALPDALRQATEAITESGVLAVQKAQALAFEQIQVAGIAGQNVGQARELGIAEVAQATAQATGTQIPLGPLPDWVGQLEEAVTAPLQLAIQKEQASGIQRVQIAEATGADLVRVQRQNADAIAQIWYQATQQLTSLKNDLTTGSLSGLTAANQVTASLEHFNTVLGLVQSGNTNFISELATAGQAAVQASTQAYGNGPQTASVRQQIYDAIGPFLVSASGYPTTGATAIAAAAAASATSTGASTDLRANTSALQDLTTAITSTLGGPAAITSTAAGLAAAPTGVTSSVGSSTASASTAAAAASAGPVAAPAGTQLYSITQPGGGPSYVGDLTPENLAWWQNTGATVTPFTGALPTARPGAALYSINQSAATGNPTSPNYVGDLMPADVGWWLNAGATVTPYSAPATASRPTTPANQKLATPANQNPATPANQNLTTNPVTGQSFTGSGITAVTPNFPVFPSASTLSNALADAIAGSATAADWTAINQALKAGILDPSKQPGYALVIAQAQRYAAGEAINPGADLSQALSDAIQGTPSLQEWALINQAVNSGILSPVAQPQYATVIRQAQVIANAQAVSLSQTPNNETAYSTRIYGLPAFAEGTSSTPPGLILTGERGPEWYQAANENSWTQVGVHGPEMIGQPGGATILPFPSRPPGQSFATGTSSVPSSSWTGGNGQGSGGGDKATIDALKKLNADLVAAIDSLRKQLMGGQIAQDQNDKAGHELTRRLVQNTGPNLAAPVRRAV